MNTSRTLASYNKARTGYQSCMEPCCWAPGRQRKFAKREWKRAIRRSEMSQIHDEIRDHNDRNHDADFKVYEMGLTIANARNLRSVDWDY